MKLEFHGPLGSSKQWSPEHQCCGVNIVQLMWKISLFFVRAEVGHTVNPKCRNMASFGRCAMTLNWSFYFPACLFYIPFHSFIFSYFETRIQPRLTLSFLCSPGSPRGFDPHCLPPKCRVCRHVVICVVLELLGKHLSCVPILPLFFHTEFIVDSVFHLFLFGRSYYVWQFGILCVCVATAGFKQLLSSAPWLVLLLHSARMAAGLLYSDREILRSLCWSQALNSICLWED